MKATEAENGRRKWQGMNWISQVSRLAIYLRDGLACSYCGASVEQGTVLSLDHVKPHSKGGDNAPTNLVTCCKRCNDSRGNRPLARFARAVAEYVNHGVTPEAILKTVRNNAGRSVKPFRAEARDLIERRGSASKALDTFRYPAVVDDHAPNTTPTAAVVRRGGKGTTGRAEARDNGNRTRRAMPARNKRGCQRSAKTKAARPK